MKTFALQKDLVRIFILILIIILLIKIFIPEQNNIENFGNFKHQCKHKIANAIDIVLKDRKMKKVDDESFDYYFPCSYTHCEQDIVQFKKNSAGKKIFLIDGCDTFASKVKLWESIKMKYLDKACKIMPETFILNNTKDMDSFKEFFKKKKDENPKSKFILKNFKQRQEGLRLVDNLDDVEKGVKDDFKIVQDYLENPYLISDRKINIRIYVLIVCHEGNIGAWIYNDGFLYYTAEKFEPYSMDSNKTITSGYISRDVYKSNPLTLEDFRKKLGKEKSKKLDNSIKDNINKVINALSGFVCIDNELKKHIKFQIFGADIAPDENLNVTLMEFNKGPDIGFKDEKDGNLKKNMIKEAFNIIDPSKNSKVNSYTRVY